VKKGQIIFQTVYIVIFAVIIWWIIEIRQGNMPYVDQWTRGLVVPVDNTFVHTFFSSITQLGSRPFILPFTILMTFFLWYFYRQLLPALFFGFGTLGAQLLNRLMKHLVARERPSISTALYAKGYSFPSGHAMTSMVCYGLLVYFLTEKITSSKVKFWLRIGFGLLILLVGTSRYFINVHYLTDVISGFYIGSLYLLSIIFVYKKVCKK